MSLRWSSPIFVYESLSWMTIVEPLSALFMMIVSWMISFFRACLYVYVRLSLGFLDICNVLSTSSLMYFTFTLYMWLRWYCCWCVWLAFVGGGWVSA